MSETRYLISETAKLTETDPHVLRYWEEELKLPIGRNQMGHRFYTGQDIHVFMEIKELKKQGLSLKAIRERVPVLYEEEAPKPPPAPPAEVLASPSGDVSGDEEALPLEIPDDAASKSGETEEVREPSGDGEKLERFWQIMDRLIDQVIQSEHQEARCRRLDEAIRRRQQSRKQVAAALEKDRRGGKKKK